MYSYDRKNSQESKNLDYILKKKYRHFLIVNTLSTVLPCRYGWIETETKFKPFENEIIDSFGSRFFFSFENLEEWIRACQKVNAGLEKSPMFGLVRRN